MLNYSSTVECKSNVLEEIQSFRIEMFSRTIKLREVYILHRLHVWDQKINYLTSKLLKPHLLKKYLLNQMNFFPHYPL